ncbi:sugar ABC transporter ATP-binding protein [Clostridiaceae bacterium NSJ-31]|uniref:Sugar ABC transporter ATP-binding protein n=1 Tax=Ligaoa zhengdingensis TaxID=2763658 RepID=A0A926I5R6_9FIRM|nr:sugar ABC transporter ATP-binding protein [Ligaoa zhengdingensis]MBC8547566.1 sugar ABC transporter ATP-binding protein [Ligaoa zhengdingensis]
MAYLQLQGISKFFHGVRALNQVSVEIERGEIHVLIGENGAGKSTLMKIVAGLYQQDEGTILLDGQEVRFGGPLDAIQHHISMIHQELMPIPYLTVAENIFLGREPLNKAGLLDKKKLIAQAEELFQMIGIDIDPRTEMRRLSVAQIQLVEIAKAVSFNSQVLIMDEPTSAISDKEIEKLYKLIFKLKADGVAIVFISHKLDEIFRVADKITVLRDGDFIGTKPASELDKDTLISMMIGRDLTNIYYKEPVPIGEPVLEVRNLTKAGLFEDISFTLHQNEILGIAGLMGAGRTELVETIFGMRSADSGQILIKGKEVSIKCPTDAQKNGLALIPEDRKKLGLDLKDSTGFNISLCDLNEFNRCGMIDKKTEAARVDDMIREMNVKVTSRKSPVVSLSGGNQQKVVLAKWLMTAPDILIMDEPTRGIDIGAKTEIYKLITKLAQQGKSVIMVSSELPEVIGMSDRVLVLCAGHLTGELTGEQINQQDIMRCATNQVASVH